MFETLQKIPADKIMAVMAEFAADDRKDKVDLGVGVYKDESGITPIMSAVKKAEKLMVSNDKTKTYLGSAGNKGFCDAVIELAFGDSMDLSRAQAVQAPGGTGSLWVLLQLIQRAKPGGRIFVSDPTWPNHIPMAKQAGFELHTYPYFDPETCTVKFDEMLACLDGLGPNDTVLLHACCHNPTGANLTPAQWDQVAASLKKTGAFPLVDLAYLGFGDGLVEDGYAVRKFAAELSEFMVAFSCSKNFGLYRERIGAAICVAPTAELAVIAKSNMANIARTSYSQPPDHGAEIVRLILTTPDLKAEWEKELTEMRERMLRLRKKLADAIRERSNTANFDFVAEHRGMFSLLGMTKEQVLKIRADNAVYMIEDSRINVAGLPEPRLGELADALLKVTR